MSCPPAGWRFSSARQVTAQCAFDLRLNLPGSWRTRGCPTLVGGSLGWPGSGPGRSADRCRSSRLPSYQESAKRRELAAPTVRAAWSQFRWGSSSLLLNPPITVRMPLRRGGSSAFAQQRRTPGSWRPGSRQSRPVQPDTWREAREAAERRRGDRRRGRLVLAVLVSWPGSDYPRCVTNRSVIRERRPAHGPGPGQPARMFTGATLRPERDCGSERKPEDWSHGRGQEARGCGVPVFDVDRATDSCHARPTTSAAASSSFRRRLQLRSTPCVPTSCAAGSSPTTSWTTTPRPGAGSASCRGSTR